LFKVTYLNEEVKVLRLPLQQGFCRMVRPIE
jgi:hypothetical protein